MKAKKGVKAMKKIQEDRLHVCFWYDTRQQRRVVIVRYLSYRRIF